MAHIVFGLGTSHSPQLNTPSELWPQHGEGDKKNPYLYDREGTRVTYDQLLAAADPALQREVSPDVQRGRFQACNRAVAALQQAVAETPLDALVIFGDDQDELFHDDFRPALAILWGESVEGMPNLYSDSPNPTWQAAAWAYGNKGQLYPVASELGLHLIESVIDAGFEPAHSNGLPRGKGVGHAFGFILGRILNGRRIPIVPVIINTLYPPNQPLPDRCYRLGEVVRSAIEAWPKDMRIGIVGSGGLSHFVIDQELDHRFLDAIRTRDAKTLLSLPRKKLNSGTSELRSWLAAAAALDHLQMRLVDYVPCYRTPAGTGMGMTFALWS